MNFKLIITLFCLLICPLTNWGEPPQGKSTELSAKFVAAPERPFQYQPVDPTFWRNIEKLFSENQSLELINQGARQIRKHGDSSAEGAEGSLALGLGFMSHRLTHAAQFTFVQLAKERIGTAIGQAALHYLSLLSQGIVYDEQALVELLNSNEFGTLHPDIQSFVSYHKYIYNLRFGFDKWANHEKKKIKAKSYWDFANRYWTSVSDIAQNHIDAGFESFKLLALSDETPTFWRQKARLQYARLLFERGQFELAFNLYSELDDVDVREKGRILLEKAWTRFYLKDYAKALGMLAALRAPYFLPSQSFERYILEMLIYRELCHYEAVSSVAKKFFADFKPALARIRKRLPLREDPLLANMALLNRDLQTRANLINQLRQEQNIVREYSWSGFSFYTPLLEEYNLLDKKLQMQLDMDLEPRVRQVAEDLLDAKEQITFLEYTSKLDSLRIVRQGEERNYQSEEISYLDFTRIYWPQDQENHEYWWDELDQYKVLISSRCNRATNDEKMRQEEREFK